MKLKRKGGLTAGIITLSAVALTSVGFAAWVISAGDTATVTGNIEVDTVDDDSHIIYGVYDKAAGIEGTTDHSVANIKAGGSTQKIRFGAPVNQSDSSGKWLSYNRGEGPEIYESLTATYYVCVLNGSVAVDGLTVANYIKAGFSVVNPELKTPADAPLAAYSGYDGAQSLGLVGATHTVTVTRLTDTGIEKDVTPSTGILKDIEDNIVTPSTARRTWYSVVVTFSWGSLWNGNPYNYYNAMASNDEVYDMGYAAWESGHSYNVGDIVTIESESKSYKCKTANSDASFTAANWDEYKISASAHANKYLTALNKLLTGVSYKFTFKSYANSTERGNDSFASDSGDNKLTVVA